MRKGDHRMKHTIQKMTTALRIEYHWWRIRRLKKAQQRGVQAARRIELHRYRAAQLASLYEVLAGIRDTAGKVIG